MQTATNIQMTIYITPFIFLQRPQGILPSINSSSWFSPRLFWGNHLHSAMQTPISQKIPHMMQTPTHLTFLIQLARHSGKKEMQRQLHWHLSQRNPPPPSAAPPIPESSPLLSPPHL